MCPFNMSKLSLQPVSPTAAVLATLGIFALLAATVPAAVFGFMQLTFGLLGASVLLFAGKATWDQYSPLIFHGDRLPRADVGMPLIGYTLERLSGGPSDEKGWFRKMRERLGPAFTTNFASQNVVVIDYSLYEKHMLDLERAGKLSPTYPESFTKLLGESSIEVLPAGAKHSDVRKRVLSALSSKQAIERLPEIEARCRAALEAMAIETSSRGQTALVPHVDRLTLEVALAFVVGRLGADHMEELLELLPAALAGLTAFPPWELSGLSPFGKAMTARRRANAIVDDMVKRARISNENTVVRALSRSNADGQSLTPEEIQDTSLTVAVAGAVTTALATTSAVVQLANRPESISRCAEPLDSFRTGIEDNSRPLLQFIRESMRFKVPVSGFRRSQPSAWTSIGEHKVPPGMAITASVDSLGCPLLGLIDRSAEFDPQRWTDSAYVAKNFLFWGGKQPHSCAGKPVALVEMQVFLQMLCRDYDFEVLSQETTGDRFMNSNWKDGLPMRVRRKISCDN